MEGMLPFFEIDSCNHYPSTRGYRVIKNDSAALSQQGISRRAFIGCSFLRFLLYVSMNKTRVMVHTCLHSETRDEEKKGLSRSKIADRFKIQWLISSLFCLLTVCSPSFPFFLFLCKWVHVIDSTKFKFLFRVSVLGLRDAEAKYSRRESLSCDTLIFRELSHDNHVNTSERGIPS